MHKVEMLAQTGIQASQRKIRSVPAPTSIARLILSFLPNFL